MKKSLLLLILALLLMFPATAFAVKARVDVGQLRYTVDTDANTAEVYGPISSDEKIHNLVIPNTIYDRGRQIPVTAIRNDAFKKGQFYRNPNITGTLTIGKNIQSIGENAFYNCSGLTGSLTIGNSVTTIGSCAFYSCSGLTGSLTIGNSVNSIGSHAFFGCAGFTGSLTIGNSVTTIGDGAFIGCYGFTGSLTIGDSVTTIGNDAFDGCFGFTGSLTIGDNVTTIGHGAFEGCYGFTRSLTIGDSVTTIGERAFYGCSGFTGSLTIGDSVTTIGSFAFYECEGFTGSLTIGDSVTTIGERAFSYCSGFTGSLTIGDSVTTIGSFAFYKCEGFTGSLTIGDSVTTIGECAFSYCSGFTGELTIGDSVWLIERYTFYGCGFTGSLTIGNSVTKIGEGAFQSCSNISSLDIKSTDLKINYYAFYNMDALQSITCYATTPPECIYSVNYLNNIFSQYTPQLYVPSEAIDKYKTATEWKKFTNIKPIPVPATSITLNKSVLNLTVGESETLIASLFPENTTETVTWSSADEAVATVDADGLVKAVSMGTTTITAATVDGLTAECSVTVTEDSGVSGIYDNGLRVSVNGSVIKVTGAGDKVVRIMAADGKPVFTAQGDCHANVVPGFYLVVVGDNVTKVVAKY